MQSWENKQSWKKIRLRRGPPPTGGGGDYRRSIHVYRQLKMITTHAPLDFAVCPKSDAFFVHVCNTMLRNCICWRPYRVECTGSLLTSEVKRRRARLVLGWGTAREDLRVLSAFVCDACAAGAQPNFACVPMRCVAPEAACRACLTAHTPRRCARQSVGGTAGVHGDAPARTCAGLVAADGHTASNAPDLF